MVKHIEDLNDYQRFALSIWKANILGVNEFLDNLLGGDHMISDYWLYQKGDVQTPWALYLVKEYDRRHPSATVLDYTLYHEDIDTPTKSISRVGLHHDTVGGYVNDIINDILEFAEIHSDDREQLERFILEVLTS